MASGIPENIANGELECIDCKHGNIKRAPFPHTSDSRFHASRILERLHVDVAGPVEVPSLGGNRYVLFLRDDYSRYCDALLIRYKSEVPTELKGWITHHEARLELKLKFLRSDSGGEFISEDLESWLYGRGIIHERTVRESPQQNGVVERLGGIIFSGVRAMLLDAGLDGPFWGEAVKTKVHLENIAPCSTHLARPKEKTPAELFLGRRPDIRTLRVFGSHAIIRDTHGAGKLAPPRSTRHFCRLT